MDINFLGCMMNGVQSTKVYGEYAVFLNETWIFH